MALAPSAREPLEHSAPSWKGGGGSNPELREWPLWGSHTRRPNDWHGRGAEALLDPRFTHSDPIQTSETPRRVACKNRSASWWTTLRTRNDREQPWGFCKWWNSHAFCERRSVVGRRTYLGAELGSLAETQPRDAA